MLYPAELRGRTGGRLARRDVGREAPPAADGPSGAARHERRPPTSRARPATGARVRSSAARAAYYAAHGGELAHQRVAPARRGGAGDTENFNGGRTLAVRERVRNCRDRHVESRVTTLPDVPAARDGIRVALRAGGARAEPSDARRGGCQREDDFPRGPRAMSDVERGRRYAIAGLGARAHETYLPLFAEGSRVLRPANLVAVVDADPARLGAFAAAWPKRVATYLPRQFDRMLSEVAPDASPQIFPSISVNA